MRWLALSVAVLGLLACTEVGPEPVGQRMDALAAAYTGPVKPWGIVRKYFAFPISVSGDEPLTVTFFGGLPPNIYRDCLCGPPKWLWGYPQTAGVWPVRITASNAEGSDTQTITFHIRALTPRAPVDNISEGGFVMTPTPVLMGTAADTEPGDVVHAASPTGECTSAVGGDGLWNCELPALDAGVVEVSTWIQNQDEDWAFPRPLQKRAFRYLPRPTPPRWLLPSDGGVWHATPSLAGTGEPTGIVTVLHGSAPVCTAEVDSAGSWACTTEAALPDGRLTLSLVQADALGAQLAGESATFCRHRLG